MDWYAIVKDFAAPVVGLLGISVTGYFACAGLRTFDRWKREKLEEKRIDVAIDALALAFESQVVFDYIRARLTRLYDVPIGNDRHIQEYSLRAVLKRVEERQPFFDRALMLEPKFVAVFGRDKATIFEHLFSARHQVMTFTEALIDDYRTEIDPENMEARKQPVKWRKQISASPGIVDPEDEVGKLLQQFRSEVEELCRPIVDRSFK
jgi:hypothetical protein